MTSERTAPIRLLVVDDHNLFRRGLVALLSQDRRLSVVGEAGEYGELRSLMRQQRCDVLVREPTCRHGECRRFDSATIFVDLLQRIGCVEAPAVLWRKRRRLGL